MLKTIWKRVSTPFADESGESGDLESNASLRAQRKRTRNSQLNPDEWNFGSEDSDEQCATSTTPSSSTSGSKARKNAEPKRARHNFTDMEEDDRNNNAELDSDDNREDGLDLENDEESESEDENMRITREDNFYSSPSNESNDENNADADADDLQHDSDQQTSPRQTSRSGRTQRSPNASQSISPQRSPNTSQQSRNTSRRSPPQRPSNHIYALKKEVAVTAAEPHYAMFSFPYTLGSTHDFQSYKSHSKKYEAYLAKSAEEKANLRGDNNNYWGILGDSAYIGQVQARTIAIPKRSDKRSSSPNVKTLKRMRVPVEQFFGRMKQIWHITKLCYRLDHSHFDIDFDICVLLTNEHIRESQLTQEDFSYYRAYKLRRLEQAKQRQEKAAAAKRAYLERRDRAERLEEEMMDFL